MKILLVACLSIERSKSSFDIPQPLSFMEISRPPFQTSNLISLLPASNEFSINSLIILVGFSTTSPAAIALETLSSKILIRLIFTSSI